MSGKYTEYRQLNLPSIGDEILAKWQKENSFEKSVELREGKTPFVFYEGPPSANGMPGIHHVISRTLKDLVCRYKTMQGFQVKRKGGWDTHGLPIELGVEKELGITKEDIGVKISVEDYNKKCREVVMRYKDKWDDITQKMGYWVDLKNPYVTFENNYVESLWWCLSELYKKGYLYESVSIQPYSPAAGTGLSSHELNQPGTYKDVKDTSAIAMFKVIANEKSEFLFKEISNKPVRTIHPGGKQGIKNDEVFLTAWTTTPWTLPSNLGLTVEPNIDYVLVKTFNPYTFQKCFVVLAKLLMPKYFFNTGTIPSGFRSVLNLEERIIKLDHSNTEEVKETSKLLIEKGLVTDWEVIAEFKGKELEGITYEQLLPSEANTLEKIQELTPGAQPFKVITGDFVTTEDGTGIVHTAPAFGADDFKAGQKNNLGILTLVDKQGKFTEGVGEFSNRYVKNYKDDKDYVDVNIDIAVKLKKENRAFKVEKYEHSYPHCWRTDKPIIYYPLDAWFIKTTAVKDRMVELNKTINWKPASTGTGRFGNWLENVVDWNLSRSRFWGTPLPIWKTEDGEEEKCIGSIEELNNEIKKAAEVLGGETNKHYLHEGILDLHKPYVDEITLVSPTGKPMQRVPDLIDVWFDSGAMPYAQWHFPFENVETFAKSYPADFIAEGVDQTRGWFYTLHALAALLKESIDEELAKHNLSHNSSQTPPSGGGGLGLAYKTVVSNGLVLDKNAVKMSKRLGNIVDPFETITDFGADATRWYLITNASPWDSLKFDIEGIKEAQRKFFGTLYNTYQFFALYANVDGFAFKEKYIPVKDRPEIDQWILSSLNSLIKEVQENFDAYEPTQAGRAIEDFVDAHLSNWYVRLCRRRFWKGEYEHDKISAYQTLYECLETLCKLMAPVAPFFADWLFNNLNSVSKRFTIESVHHTDFPKADETVIDIDLEKRMQLAQDISSLVLAIRKKVKIRVRQPLQKIMIPVNEDLMYQIKKVEDIIKNEINVKEIILEDPKSPTVRFKKKIKPNYKTLGSVLGKKIKIVAKWAEVLNSDDNNLFQSEMNRLSVSGTGVEIYVKDGEPLMNYIGHIQFDHPEAFKIPENEYDDCIKVKGTDFEITTEDIPGWESLSNGSLTVALDIIITDDLKKEGDAREFVNRIQTIRKESGFNLTDRIDVTVRENDGLQPSLIQYKDYICAEILADSLAFLPEITDGFEIEVNDAILKVNVLKKGQ